MERLNLYSCALLMNPNNKAARGGVKTVHTAYITLRYLVKYT